MTAHGAAAPPVFAVTNEQHPSNRGNRQRQLDDQ
jgi:hypothetical protein